MNIPALVLLGFARWTVVTCWEQLCLSLEPHPNGARLDIVGRMHLRETNRVSKLCALT